MLIEQRRALIPEQLRALTTAKHTAEPTAIRAAISQLELTRALLLANSAIARRAIVHAPPATGVELTTAAEAAEAAAESLLAPIEHARGQVQRLENVASGALTSLPEAQAPATPDQTRMAAREVAPLGLCDDRAMQAPDSHACPLDATQRDAVREEARRGLAQIADHWQSAAAHEHVTARLKPLLRKGGLHPLVGLLVSVAGGWLMSQVGALVGGAIGAAQDAVAARELRKLAEVTPIGDVVASRTKELAAARSMGSMLKGVGSKLAGAAAGAGRSYGPTDNVGALFAGIQEVAAAWNRQAQADVRQLPDPALVALAQAVQTAPFTNAYFRARIEQLVERFEEVETIGRVTELGQEALRPVWVVAAAGRPRLALARNHRVPREFRVPGGRIELGQEVALVRTGKLEFVSWVDRALTEIALTHNAAPAVLTENDSRWVTPPGEYRDDGDVKLIARPSKKDPP